MRTDNGYKNISPKENHSPLRKYEKLYVRWDLKGETNANPCMVGWMVLDVFT